MKLLEVIEEGPCPTPEVTTQDPVVSNYTTTVLWTVEKFSLTSGVVRQSSGSRQAVVRQSSGSRQADVRQSSSRRQAVVRQSSGAVAALAEIVLFLQFLNVLFRPQGLFSR